MGASTPISEGSAPRTSQSAALHAEEVQFEEVQSSAARDLWIFRDGKRHVAGPALLSTLQQKIAQGEHDHQSLIDSLIEAGELEAALADANSPSAGLSAEVTDQLAWAICCGALAAREALRISQQVHPPDSLSISPPEGFTYYALHPLDYAKVVSQIPADPAGCALIGIRSIGTTLSAMCAAALKQAGRKVSRITVRPTGHPYAREMNFTSEQIEWIRGQLPTVTKFLVIDEGPGRSGSTFLSVAEALVRAGVPHQQITLVGSRIPDPSSLCAHNALHRWNSFCFLSTTPSVNSRFEQCTYAGGGHWRNFVFSSTEVWPESWTEMERLKFISPGRSSLFKFEGMGPLGAEVQQRAFILAENCFSPQVENAGDGFLNYEFVSGRPARVQDVSTSLLDRLAEYCAFRSRAFPANDADLNLRQMLEFNVKQEFGVDLQLPNDALTSASPVLADARMQPYEWMFSNNTLLKTDAISHGDDHFFPGPCDIAWDIAGTAVEWQLDGKALAYLIAAFERLNGTTCSADLPLYMLAYAVFRFGFCKMAISTVRGSDEELRLRAACRRYRAVASSLLSHRLAARGSQAA